MKIWMPLLLLTTAQAYAFDVGFQDSEFYVGIELGQDTYHFQLCPDKLPKPNKRCFAISACEFGNENMRKAVSDVSDADLRSEMEMLLSGSFVSNFKMDVFVPKLIEVLKKTDSKKECVFVTDLPEKIFPKKKAEDSTGAPPAKKE